MKEKAEVQIIGTGGTITMMKNKKGSLVPTKELKDIIKLLDLDIGVSIHSITNIDSSDMDNETRKRIADKIQELCDLPYKKGDFDLTKGIVIIHGTDTLTDTAQYLTYAIKNIRKPIILTGAQIPVEDPKTDGIVNLKDAIQVAYEADLSGIFVLFDKKLYPSENIAKVMIWDKNAFACTEQDMVGRIICGKLELFEKRKGRKVKPRGSIYYSPGEFFRPETYADTNFKEEGIREILIRPNTKLEDLIKIVKDKKTDAIIIHGYGAGHIPTKYHDFLEQAKKNDKLVVICSKAAGSVDLTEYEIGRKGLEKGALPAGDWMPDEVYWRLSYVLGKKDYIKRLMQTREFKTLDTLLKSLGLETPTVTDILKYTFLCGAVFKDDEKRKQHEKELKIPIEKDDLIRNPDINLAETPNPFYDGLIKTLSYRLSEERTKVEVVRQYTDSSSFRNGKIKDTTNYAWAFIRTDTKTREEEADVYYCDHKTGKWLMIEKRCKSAKIDTNTPLLKIKIYEYDPIIRKKTLTREFETRMGWDPEHNYFYLNE